MISKWIMEDPSNFAWFGYLVGYDSIHSNNINFEINMTKEGRIMKRLSRPPIGEDYE